MSRRSSDYSSLVCRFFGITLIFATLACDDNGDFGDPLRGYYVSAADVAATIPDTTEGAPYTVQIDRSFSGPQEEELLRIAEATYPPIESIFEELAQNHVPRQNWPEEQADLWWWDQFDGVRIPYAVTKSSVAYYRDLSDAFRRGEFDSLGTPPMSTSSFRYSARIEPHERYVYQGHRFGDVYVANLSLHWSNYCGNLCALWFTKTRIVILSRSGQLRGVFGDGISGFTVS